MGIFPLQDCAQSGSSMRRQRDSQRPIAATKVARGVDWCRLPGCGKMACSAVDA